eukprot:GEMP01016203.1.p1 GENE.GEMP01016203.1~~GEMP01016203.1.p1  ORF type:complete len:485 (+),score=150.33 GEMP01016203.1:134-1588(+)
MPLTDISQALVRSIVERHPSLQALNLSHNEISVAENLESLGSALQSLNLAHNIIYALTPRSFIGIPDVRELILSHNRIKVLDRDCFAQLRALTKLDLSYNHLDDMISLQAALAPVSSTLRHLNLIGNVLSPATYSEPIIFACPALATLDEQPVERSNCISVIDPAKGECPPVYFEDVLETHRWVMNYIAATEQKVSNVHQSDLEGRDSVWKEAVWALAVQKRCLELEISKVKTTADCKDEVRKDVTALLNKLQSRWDKLLDNLTKHERRLEELNGHVRSLQCRLGQEKHSKTSPDMPPPVQRADAESDALLARLQRELADCRRQLVEKDHECRELLARKEDECREQVAHKEREVQRVNELFHEARTQLRLTEEASEREAASSKTRARQLEVDMQDEISEAIAEKDKVWQQRYNALQQQLLRLEAKDACAVEQPSASSDRPSKSPLTQQQAGDASSAPRKDMVDLLREVRTLEHATSHMLKDKRR